MVYSSNQGNLMFFDITKDIIDMCEEYRHSEQIIEGKDEKLIEELGKIIDILQNEYQQS